MYDHYFSNFGRPPVSDDICKDSVRGILGFGEQDFKGFSHTNAKGSKLDLALKRSNVNIRYLF